MTSFLLPTTSAIVNNAPEPTAEKVSESEPIPQVANGPADKESPEVETERVTDIVSEAGFSVIKADYFQTDTSDIEELLDSSGAETAKESPFLIAIESQSATGSEARKETEQLTSAGLPDVSSNFSAPHDLYLPPLALSSINISLRPIQASSQWVMQL